MPIIIKNTEPKSNIASASIEFPDQAPSTTLQINGHDGDVFQMNDERIVLFYNECLKNKSNSRYALSPNLLAEIKSKYAHIFDEHAKNQPLIDQEEINELYTTIYKNILFKREESTRKEKPLLILIGEHHCSSASLLFEIIILEIARNFGIKRLCLEMEPNKLGHADVRSSLNMNFLYSLAEFKHMTIDCIEEKEHRDLYIAKAGNEAGAKLGMELRNFAMSNKLKNAFLNRRFLARDKQIIDIKKSLDEANKTSAELKKYLDEKNIDKANDAYKHLIFLDEIEKH